MLLPSHFQCCSKASPGLTASTTVLGDRGDAQMGPHSLLISCIKGTLKINKSNNGMCGASQRSLLLKEFQATQGRSAHLALLRPADLNRASLRLLLVWSFLWLSSPETGSRGCVPPLPLLQPLPPVTVTHSDTDMPFRPRRGWGWPTLRSPGTNSRQQLCPKADSSRSLATVFSSQLGYRLYVVPLLQTAAPETIKPRPQGSVGFEKSVRKAKRWSIRPPSLYGVHYVPQARSPDQRLKRRKPSH